MCRVVEVNSNRPDRLTMLNFIIERAETHHLQTGCFIFMTIMFTLTEARCEQTSSVLSSWTGEDAARVIGCSVVLTIYCLVIGLHLYVHELFPAINVG